MFVRSRHIAKRVGKLQVVVNAAYGTAPSFLHIALRLIADWQLFELLNIPLHAVHMVYPVGGAGTWSDGKLTTRIGRNDSPVRMVLQTLCRFGAPDSILVNGKV